MTDDAPLPPRPRRRTVTPVGAVLGAVLIAALGFLGGVAGAEVARPTSSGDRRGASRAAASRRRHRQPAAASSRSTPRSARSRASTATTFYVTDQSGNKVKVKTNKQSKVTRSAVADADEIHPGDTVIVQGTKAASGTVIGELGDRHGVQRPGRLRRALRRRRRRAHGGFGGGAPQGTPPGGG